MKKKELEEIKNKNIPELSREVNKLEKDLAVARLEQAQAKLKNPHALKSIRKSIAQIKTILKIKQILILNKKEQANVKA